METKQEQNIVILTTRGVTNYSIKQTRVTYTSTTQQNKQTAGPAYLIKPKFTPPCAGRNHMTHQQLIVQDTVKSLAITLYLSSAGWRERRRKQC